MPLRDQGLKPNLLRQLPPRSPEVLAELRIIRSCT